MPTLYIKQFTVCYCILLQNPTIGEAGGGGTAIAVTVRSNCGEKCTPFTLHFLKVSSLAVLKLRAADQLSASYYVNSVQVGWDEIWILCELCTSRVG